ncbi:tyrosine-type recombinase/integrase [Pseudomonas tolaasii]|uniref:tyrosine-type recombinase/integrase n=1 Tax=Pseudomonas tolaasii TaxID=29442 RepID=UPI001C563131|nr:tyrosine-type recombinase/integrase [Pseudomonas tolaasii]MBW1245516.1 tyrosine-type recombinase/integrase [Pseudomonas tolaasii]
MTTANKYSKRSEKLYTLLGQHETFGSFSVDRNLMRDATNIPFMSWPNGSPCIIGNLYMLTLFNRKGRGTSRGLSRVGEGGGTMGDYAAKLGQLLRFCYRDGRDPITLHDGNFTEYITELRVEPSPKNPSIKKRTEDSISEIGRVWLDFLGFVGRLHSHDDFISPEGRIRAVMKTFEFIDVGGNKSRRTYLVHHSFGPPSRRKSRNPITTEQIVWLKETSRKSKDSNFVKARRSLLIDVLTDTGARRSEIANLTIEDVKKAKAMAAPTLTMTTLKRGGDNVTRNIPVTPTLLQLLDTFIEKARRKIIKEVYKGGKDHRYLFISETTGKRLTSKTLYNEIYKIKELAGIESQICPHMFRHRFVTEYFIDFIQQHQFNNPDDFRNSLLLNTTIFKEEVIQWTGHLSASSINTYLHLALAALSDYSATVTSIHIKRAMEGYFMREKELRQRLKEGMDVEQYSAELDLLQSLYQEDLTVAEMRGGTLSTVHQ